jgi:hypothetical protein
VPNAPDYPGSYWLRGDRYGCLIRRESRYGLKQSQCRNRASGSIFRATHSLNRAIRCRLCKETPHEPYGDDHGLNGLLAVRGCHRRVWYVFAKESGPYHLKSVSVSLISHILLSLDGHGSSQSLPRGTPDFLPPQSPPGWVLWLARRVLLTGASNLKRRVR